MPGSIQVLSALPGRVRWDVPGLRGLPRVAAAIERHLSHEPAVVSAVANALTGRVLMQFPRDTPVAEAQAWLERAFVQAIDHPEDPGALVHTNGHTPANGQSPFTWLAHRSPEHRRLATRSLGASFLNRMLDGAPPLMIGAAIDVVTRGPQSFLAAFGLKTLGAQFVALGGLTALVWTLDAAVGYVQQVTEAEIANRVRHDLRTEVYAHLQRLDVAQIEARPVSAWMALLDEDINEVAEFFRDGADPIVSVAANGMVIATTFVILSPGLALIQFLLVPPLVVASSRMLPPLRAKYKIARRDAGELKDTLFGNMASMPTIAGFGTHEAEAARVQQASRKHLESTRAAAAVGAAYVPTLQMIVGAGFVSTLVMGAAQVTQGQLTAGAYNILAFGDLRLLSALGRMGKFLDDYQRAQIALDRILSVLEMKPAIVGGTRALPAADLRGEIVIENVDFGYDADRRVFNGLNLRFPAGATVGIVGSTGAGKSTVLKLIQRFYDPQGGAIRLDGIDIRELQLEALRSAIATVPQEISLFAGTIRENIAYGRPDATLAEVESAARVAEAHTFIEKLPLGYESRVGFGGKTLSVGERQRLAIARVVLADRPILLFDEATSALDHETEASIQRALAEITRDRTTIIVAHRLSTIRNADLICVLDDGQVREQGSHDELLEADGVYASLWRVQTGDALHPKRAARAPRRRPDPPK